MSTNNCTDCKSSILNSTTSTILTPACQEDCGESVDCNGEVVASDCVYVNVPLTCLETSTGDKLTTVLQTIDAALCNSVEAGCQVKINANDCCDYLGNKVVEGSGVSIAEVSSGSRGCTALQVSLDCPVWNSATLASKWVNFGGVHQTLEYSSVVGCVVKIRGTVKTSGSYSTGATTIFTLPANHRPLKQRTFGAYPVPVNVNTNTHFGYFTIKTTGEVQFTFYDNTASGSILLLPVELTFETN